MLNVLKIAIFQGNLHQIYIIIIIILVSDTQLLKF